MRSKKYFKVTCSLFWNLTFWWPLLCWTSIDKDSKQNLQGQSDLFYLCKKSGLVRTVRSDLNLAGVCQATYTKGGVDQLVGSAKNKAECRKIVNNVKENLVGGKWACREISASAIKSSSQ